MPTMFSTFEADFTQDTRLLRLTTPLGNNTLLAESAGGEEGIGTAFSFQIRALSLDADISLRSLLGQPALLELLTVESGVRRPFHGYLTSVELNGANGGFARYTLTLQPWTAFLAHGRDSRIFQDKTVFEILDAVFWGWSGKGRLTPQWRFDIADRAVYPVRSLATQYQESDLAFAERLMSEEGLFYFFEHEAGGGDFGTHRMVIADHNGAFKAASQDFVRYTQPGAVMKEDSMDRWRREVRAQATAVEWSSWDYRTRNSRPVAAAAETAPENALVARDVPGQYGYADRVHGQRLAERALQAIEARRDTYTGAGTVRTLGAGTTFSLYGHAVSEGEFLATRVVHLMHNNLGAQLRASAEQALGAAPSVGTAATLHGLRAVGTSPGERPLYRNRVDAIPSGVPYRGEIQSRPLVLGQQTAVVVGPPGAVVHTDRDHRVKVQFHWQRDAATHASHSRMSHPNPDGQTGAPGDDTAGTWVRVATPLAPIAGANWGSHALPRVGQEVLVDFMEGDIDRPVIIGALYNGRGEPDAQYNRVAGGAGAASGNAPAWFPGEANAHAHPAALSGIKSQAMQSSQDGAGAYSQLVFDDTPGQARMSLQRHAGAHRGTDELNLGSLRHQTDNQRLQPVGFGAELKTEHGAALRAGKGMLLSADLRSGGGTQMDALEAREQITASHQMQQALAETAQKHHPSFSADAGQTGDIPAVKQFGGAAQALTRADGVERGHPEPQLQLSAPGGIVAVTPANAVIAAGHTTGIAAGQDIALIAEANIFHSVAAGVSLFTYGKASNKGKPNQETGIRLHASSGKFMSESSAGPTRLIADKGVTVASISRAVVAQAKTHLLLTAQGAGLKLEGGNITIQAPGKVEFKASLKELAGPADASAPATKLPTSQEIYNEAFVVVDEQTGQPLAHVRYRLESESGVVIDGVTDALGRTERIFTKKREKLTLHLPKEE